jgi:multidrug efflux pump
MKFTDIFIRKPVLAIVVSLVILVLGLRSISSLPIRQFPKTENATITVTTAYFGANPEVVAGFITTPLETAIAQAQGIDYLSSRSTTGQSTITATLRLNYDSNRALTEINTKVNSVLNQLPPETQQPSITVSTGEISASMYIGFASEVLPGNKITDYLVRVVKPKIQAVPGVQEAEVVGSGEFALRAWLDPQRLAGMGVTAEDVFTAINNNNYISAVGTTKGQMVTVNLTADTDLHSVEEFKNLAVKRKGNTIVRLKDVANVMLGSDMYDFTVAYKGTKGVFIAINVAPEANVLTVVGDVRKLIPDIQAQLPAGLRGEIAYDATKFVDRSISEVQKTLIETLVIVSIVIFLFLGTLRSVLVPTIAMPLSLIGAFFIMLALGYSINLLTLLALVLAIGLVVDDAIIIVENIDRHMKEGMAPVAAALTGARELSGPIIAISVVLIAVYVPIGFQGGLTGTLFSEFAFTLAGAVAVSAVIALTLSPMMCSRLFAARHGEDRLAKMIDRNFDRFRNFYRRTLHVSLDHWSVFATFGFIVIGLILVLFKLSQSELAPEEDQGIIPFQLTGAPTSTLDQTDLYMKQIYEIASALPEYDNMFQLAGVNGANSGFGGVLLQTWADRDRVQRVIQQELQQKYDGIAGARVAAFPFPSLPGGGDGLPLQFVIGTTEPFANLSAVAEQVMQKAVESGQFYFLDNDLKIDKPQTTVMVDRDKIATLGLTNRDVGSALSAMLGGGYVNYFSIAGRAYKVIPQVQRSDRINPDQLNNYYIRTPAGGVIPASTVISLKTTTVPQSINHFQQLNSATISGVAGVPLGQAIATLKTIAADVLPQGYSVDYAGQSRQVTQESNAFVYTLLFAIIIIYLTLAAQFESFVDPLVVMMSVPMAIFGAMIFIFEGAATLNIYTQVGLVTLIGLIAKHGILIVEFANEEQRAGKSKRSAIEAAATTRLRPILMTSAAMVLGVIPLVIASGAGAAGRNHMGIVIATGISIGTFFTLFVVPAMYMLLSRDHSKERAAAAEVQTDAPSHQAALTLDESAS